MMAFCSFCGNIFYHEEHEVEKALLSFSLNIKLCVLRDHRGFLIFGSIRSVGSSLRPGKNIVIQTPPHAGI